MKVEYVIQRSDIQRDFGGVTVEQLAATISNAFHGRCECVSHPFTWHDNGDFHGTLPWAEGKAEYGDKVVQAFRLAAVAAYDTLRSTGVGHLR